MCRFFITSGFRLWLFSSFCSSTFYFLSFHLFYQTPSFYIKKLCFWTKTGPKEWPVQVAKLKLLTVGLYQRKVTYRRQSQKIMCFKNISVNVNLRSFCSFFEATLPFFVAILGWAVNCVGYRSESSLIQNVDSSP